MNLKRILLLSMVLAGVTAMSSQVIFLREFLTVFYGNEISIGIILAAWLFWGAAGSLILGRYSDKAADKAGLLAFLEAVLFLILPLFFHVLRSSRDFLGISTGEIIGFIPMVATTFCVLSVPCALMGFIFGLACSMYRDIKEEPVRTISVIYALEAVGSLLGGFVGGYILINIFKPYYILLAVSFLNLVFSLLMIRFSASAPFKKVFSFFGLLLLFLFLFAFVSGGLEKARQRSLAELWKGYKVVDSEDSVYGNVTVTEREGQRSFYENGLNLYTVPDVFTSEEAVHYAMLESPRYDKVLLIGGGVGGLLDEILKYDVGSVEYVELDPLIVSMARKHLSPEHTAALDSPKLRIIAADGRKYIKETPAKYDCVIVHLGDPYTAQVNRFYTVEFFGLVRRALADGGVLSFSLTSSENYIGGELADYLSSIYLSLKAVFPEVVVIPGDSMRFLASMKRGALTDDYAEFVKRLKEKRIGTRFVNEYYLFADLSPERIKYFRNELEKRKTVRINTDFSPISYFYATVFWSTQLDWPAFRVFVKSLTVSKVLLAACVLFFVILASGVAWRKDFKKKALMAVATTGFAEIIFQIAVILSFQAIYGYVFYKLGFIVSSFMAGLAAGGFVMAKYMHRLKNDKFFFTLTQAAICVYPLLIPLIFALFSRSGAQSMDWVGSNVVFPLLPAVAGMIGGVQFPLAGKICLGEKDWTGRTASLAYGLDLLGACAGSLVTAVVLIPVLGIYGTCLVAALLNMVVLAVLVMK